jgi:hypothetical protein
MIQPANLHAPLHKTQRNPLIRYDTYITYGLHHLIFTTNGLQSDQIEKTYLNLL